MDDDRSFITNIFKLSCFTTIYSKSDISQNHFINFSLKGSVNTVAVVSCFSLSTKVNKIPRIKYVPFSRKLGVRYYILLLVFKPYIPGKAIL